MINIHAICLHVFKECPIQNIFSTGLGKYYVHMFICTLFFYKKSPESFSLVYK